MLYYSTIYPETLRLLTSIQQLESLKNFLLVGGTSLALQIGHRISIDLDFFINQKIEVSNIPNLLEQFGKVKIINQSNQIINLYIEDIKVDFVVYQYPFISPPINKDNLKLVSIKDIAAMKLAAITGRGSRKDFIDIYFILKKFLIFIG